MTSQMIYKYIWTSFTRNWRIYIADFRDWSFLLSKASNGYTSTLSAIYSCFSEVQSSLSLYEQHFKGKMPKQKSDKTQYSSS